MTTVKRTNAELVNLNWAPWTSDLNGSFTSDTMRTAAAIHTAKQAEIAVARLTRCMLALEGIVSRLDGLGREGLHDVVKEMARDARAKRKRRLARRRRSRLRLVPGGAA